MSPPASADLPDPVRLAVYRFADWVVDRHTRELHVQGRYRAIAPKTLAALLYLLDHRSRVVSKAELLDQVWGDVVVTENVVARAVMKVREAIGDDGGEPVLIRTVHRIGYRFVAPVA
jgi:DNA-binding winged helix-turn-helix (wHTH) protein